VEPEVAAQLADAILPEAEDVDVDLCDVVAVQPLPAGSQQFTNESSNVNCGRDESREQAQSEPDHGEYFDHDSEDAPSPDGQIQPPADETRLGDEARAAGFKQTLAEQAEALRAVEQNLDLVKSQVTDLTWRVREVEGVQRLRHQLDQAISDVRSARERQEKAEAARDVETRRRLHAENSCREEASKAEQLECSLASQRDALLAAEGEKGALRSQVENLTRKLDETVQSARETAEQLAEVERRERERLESELRQLEQCVNHLYDVCSNSDYDVDEALAEVKRSLAFIASRDLDVVAEPDNAEGPLFELEEPVVLALSAAKKQA